MLGKKKIYSKPKIEKFKVDNEISIVMGSPPPEDEENPFPSSFEVDPSDGRIFKNDIPSASDNPFGGDVPKY